MSDYRLFWGDIHNHNELGYGQGSLDRSYEIAASHLDFYAFTPHAQHADGNAPKGYEVVNANWGPMKGYEVFGWEGELRVDGGEILEVVPCFCSDPFDEVRRKRVLSQDGSGCRWQSHTSRGSIFTTRNSFPACSANDALCVEVRGTKKTRVDLEMFCQTRKSLLATPADWSIANAFSKQRESFSVGELLEGSQGFRMGGPPTWVRVHRAVPQALFTLEGEYRHEAGRPAVYYVRAAQENGQMGWSSPVWIA